MCNQADDEGLGPGPVRFFWSPNLDSNETGQSWGDYRFVCDCFFLPPSQPPPPPPSPPGWTDFENGLPPHWTNGPGASEPWRSQVGSTSSLDTGPDAAHGGDRYLFIETSSPRVEGDRTA